MIYALAEFVVDVICRHKVQSKSRFSSDKTLIALMHYKGLNKIRHTFSSLFDLELKGVRIAVPRNVNQGLGVATFFAFDPQPFTRAAIVRPTTSL